jgi:hypothetical protein
MAGKRECRGSMIGTRPNGINAYLVYFLTRSFAAFSSFGPS